MQLSTIGRAAVLVVTLAGCGAGGPGDVEGPDDPAGMFSGSGSPGPFAGGARRGNPFGVGSPGPFSGGGSPRVGQPAVNVSSVCSELCVRQTAVCAPGMEDSCPRVCADVNRANECERNLYTQFFLCLLAVDFTCDDEGNIVQNTCPRPNLSSCRPGTVTPTPDAGMTMRDSGATTMRDTGAMTRDTR